jgi:hypothetical protein
MAPQRFSLPRALRLLSVTVEVGIAVGLVAKIILVAFWLHPQFQFLRPAVDASINFVLLCIVVFVCVALARMFQNWRRGLLAIARAAVYFLLLGFTPSPLGSAEEHVGSNQSMKPTAPLRCDFSVFAMTPCRGLSPSR